MTAPALSAYHETVAMRRERVIKLTQLGHTAGEISLQLGITKRQVVRIRAKAGIAQPKAPLLTADELRLAEELLDSGCSYCEVERTIGRSVHAIARAFPGRGWPKGEGARLAAFRRWMRYRAPELEGL